MRANMQPGVALSAASTSPIAGHSAMAAGSRSSAQPAQVGGHDLHAV